MKKSRIRHIALAAEDPDKTAEFYRRVFGFEEVGRISKEKGKLAYGVMLTDGVLNIAVLRFTSDQGPRTTDFRGIHHFGVQVEDVDGDTKTIESLGGECFLRKPEGATMAFFETKFVGPDGVVFDITDHPWVGNPPDA